MICTWRVTSFLFVSFMDFLQNCKVYNEFLRLAAMEKGIPVHPRFFLYNYLIFPFSLYLHFVNMVFVL